MKNYMNFRNVTTILAIISLSLLLILSINLYAEKNRFEKSNKVSDNLEEISTETEVLQEIDEEKMSYLQLKLNNNVLRLEEISNGAEKIIKESTIDIESLPKSDVTNLENGIPVESLEYGYMMFEDFTG